MGLEILAANSVGEIIPTPGKVITVDSSVSVTTVLNTLTENNLFCLPVLDPDTRHLVGLIDMVDIVTYVVDIVGSTERVADTAHASWFLQKCEDARLQAQKNDQVAGISKKNKLCPVMSSTSLLDAMRVMVDNHVQRLPVVGVDHTVKNIVTQSAIVAFLSKHLDELGDFVDKSLESLGFKPKQVISISVDRPTIDAFRLINQHKITGIPVMDVDGTMITNISCSDLRDVATDPRLFEYLRMPLDSFIPILKARINVKSEASINVMYPKIACKFSTPLRSVIGKLAATKIHRIYITDEHDQPIGIVSLLDVIERVLHIATK